MPLSHPPFPAGTLVVAYLRDSGHEDQELSTQQQQRALDTWCKNHDLILTHSFIDQASPGSSAVNRKQFQTMISYFHQKNPKPPEKAVIVWRLNRFARNMDDAQYYKADLRRLGYDIYSLNDSIPEGNIGRIYESLIEWKDQEYLENLSVDITRGINDLFRESGAVGGRPPRGFKREDFTVSSRRDGKPRQVARWVPDPDTWELCQLAWKLKVEGASYREILERTKIYKTVNGYPSFFHNALYKGEMHFGDQVVSGYCEPMVDEATWEGVQKMMSKESRIQKGDISHPRTRNSRYALSSLVYCARCGAALIGKTVTFKSLQDFKYYYVCGARKRSHSCNLPTIPRKDLEDMVIKAVIELLDDPTYMDELTELTNVELKKLFESQVGEKPEAQALLSEVEKKITRLVDAIADRGHTSSMLDRLTALEEEKKQLTAKLATPIDQPLVKDAVRQKVDSVSLSLKAALIAKDIPEINKQLRNFAKKIMIDVQGDKIQGFIEYSLPDEIALLPKASTPPGAQRFFVTRLNIF